MLPSILEQLGLDYSTVLKKLETMDFEQRKNLLKEIIKKSHDVFNEIWNFQEEVNSINHKYEIKNEVDYENVLRDIIHYIKLSDNAIRIAWYVWNNLEIKTFDEYDDALEMFELNFRNNITALENHKVGLNNYESIHQYNTSSDNGIDNNSLINWNGTQNDLCFLLLALRENGFITLSNRLYKTIANHTTIEGKSITWNNLRDSLYKANKDATYKKSDRMQAVGKYLSM